MNETIRLIDLLNKKARLAVILAPSFPIVYEYPQIFTKLKKLGFAYVVEVSVGAKKTNEQVLSLLQRNPKSRIITSPCPSFVRMVRTKYPSLLKYLALSADSPMSATAKLVKERYPDHQPVFIGPCIAKKLESSEDRPELNILVLTYKELDEVFTNFNISVNMPTGNDKFDLEAKDTRIYPMDGGLTLTSGVNRILKDEEFRIVSGWRNVEEALIEFQSNPKIRFMDVLFCEGGCVNGPGIISTLPVVDRKKKIINYFNKKTS